MGFATLRFASDERPNSRDPENKGFIESWVILDLYLRTIIYKYLRHLSIIVIVDSEQMSGWINRAKTIPSDWSTSYYNGMNEFDS